MLLAGVYEGIAGGASVKLAFAVIICISSHRNLNFLARVFVVNPPKFGARLRQLAFHHGVQHERRDAQRRKGVQSLCGQDNARVVG